MFLHNILYQQYMVRVFSVELVIAALCDWFYQLFLFIFSA